MNRAHSPVVKVYKGTASRSRSELSRMYSPFDLSHTPFIPLPPGRYMVFRGANSDKDAFRKDPSSVPHIKYIDTERGTKLMVSGWWGLARKINYTGDWLMGLSWCLLTGFQTPVTYFYAIYFLVLLIHRADRDDHLCAIKYGHDWERYKAQVPYRFIPKVY
jgi:Delta14-sterol reductase